MQQKNVQLQGLKQILKLSPQQVLEARLLELSTEELVQRIENEILDNEALEKGEDNPEYAEQAEHSERPEEYNTNEGVLIDPEDDDVRSNQPSASPIDVASWQIRNEVTFHDQLMEQLGEMSLTDDQAIILRYLIGSLDEDGLLHKDLQKIGDEMYLYVGAMVEQSELEECLHLLQQFEPAGIGGRNLQECLMLQAERLPQSDLKVLLTETLQKHFDDICNNRWDKVADQMDLNADKVEMLQKELKRLNPRPGGSLYTGSASANTLRPDFLLTIDDNVIQVSLNNAIVPALHVSESYMAAVDAASKRANLSRRESEELAYIREKMERAQAFINAIRQRHTTLLATIQAIINRQKEYFLTGDETTLRPLTMKEVAETVKVDISTVSRVCNSKYVQTPYGTYPLRFYFVERFNPKTAQSEDVTTQKVREKLKEIIDSEDKANPYNDTQLQALMAKAGYNVARRTIAKYREQLGVKNAIMRKV